MELDVAGLSSVLANANDPHLIGASDCMDATVDAELCHHSLEMARYRLGTDHEPRRDRFRVVALGEQPQHFDFTSRQGKTPVFPRGRAVGGADSNETAANARQQLVRVERLGDVVITAEE
jgi:hypothetical protein